MIDPNVYPVPLQRNCLTSVPDITLQSLKPEPVTFATASDLVGSGENIKVESTFVILANLAYRVQLLRFLD